MKELFGEKNIHLVFAELLYCADWLYLYSVLIDL